MVERRSVNRGGGTMVQSRLPPFRKLGDFVHLTFACVFRKRYYKPVILLSGVYPTGSKISHKCVTCSGLTNSREDSSNSNSIRCNIRKLFTLSDR